MTTQTQTNSDMNNKHYLGSIMLIIGGIVLFFLLALGSFTDNRFGTHMVLNSDLSSGPDWYLYLISSIALLIVIAGIVLLVLNTFNVFRLNDSRDRTLTTGAFFLMGSAAFVLALSSISFAAFNWQYFKSQADNGIAVAATAMMTLSIIGIVASLGYTIFGLIVPMNNNEKLYLTLRNTSIGLVALGWLVFNLCINSFGAMGGDANVLIAGLTGHDGLLTTAGTAINSVDFASMDAKTFYQSFLQDAIGVPWAAANVGGFTDYWDTGTGGIADILNAAGLGALNELVASQGGLQNVMIDLGPNLVELGSGKEGMIMGVNNSFNSFLIFTLLVSAGFVGLPLYGVLTYSGTSRDNKSIMFFGSLIVILAMTLVYLFLLLTPYMVGYDASTQHVGLLELLLYGNFEPSIAPGLIALPGEAGGIHSAVVYFSDEYNGTIVWWIAEAITFIVPVAAFVGTTLFIKLKK